MANRGTKVCKNTTPRQIPTDMIKLTKKQKAFADYLIQNPKASATEAVRQAYNIKAVHGSSARTIASDTLAKTSVQAYLALHGSNALIDIVDIAKQAKSKAETATDRDSASLYTVALQANRDIADRAYGKATQKIEQQTTGITLNIDLTQALETE